MSRKKGKGTPWWLNINQSEDPVVKMNPDMRLTPDDTLIHVTINTAHSVAIPRDFVRQETRDILAPLVMAGGGRLSNLPFEFSVMDQVIGAATVDFRYVCGENVIPVVVGTICDKRSEEWWKHLLRTAKGAGVVQSVARPRSTPWLGVVLLPSSAWSIMSAEEQGFLGSLENWVAWTWLGMREVTKFTGRN
jgi:hypothetical protein